MIKKLLLTTFVMASAGGFAQQNFWTKVSKPNAKAATYERNYMPETYKTYDLDFNGIKEALRNAPSRFSKNESLILKFPNAEGKLVDYVVKEAPVFSKGLQAKYDNIRSYLGYEKGNNLKTIRFSVSDYDGVNVMFSDGKSAAYLDTFSKDLHTYIVYDRLSVPADQLGFICGFNNPDVENTKADPTENLVEDGLLRTYRLAVATTIEYSAFYVNRAGLQTGTLEQKKAAVLAGINATMTRVNGIYEKTVSLTMQLIPQNDEIVFIDSDDFTNDDPYELIDESQEVIDEIIGTANYDIGHTFSTQGGGLASLRSPCTNYKASGITGLSSPIGDAYDVDYVAHEMGHQFGATHTFDNSCGGNRTASTSVEPGSGSTIMAYAGICAPNIQFRSDPYFHVVSIRQMYLNITTGASSSCPVNTNNGNHVPVVNAGLDYDIPFGTAFTLTGTATDPDGDALTYLWEQTDIRSTTTSTAPTPTQTNGTIFRSFPPKTVSERTFPSIDFVMLNNLAPTWEVIPNISRTLNFSLFVNDQKATGNQGARDNVLLRVANAGPFKVTSHTQANTTLTGGTSTTVTWNVAGTDAAPINTQNVTISLSTDNGINYQYILAENIPNNGSAAVILPNENIENARIKIQAVNNIYFALNQTKFSITKNLAVAEAEVSTFAIYPNPAKGLFNIKLNDLQTASYQIFDFSGRLIKSGELTQKSTEINIAQLKTGNYLLVVSTADGKKTSKNLVVK